MNGARRGRLVASVAALGLAAGVGACGDDEEPTTTEPAPLTGVSGATGAGGSGKDDSGNGKSGKDGEASTAQREGTGSGLEEAIQGADTEGTDTPDGGESTTGDKTAE